MTISTADIRERLSEAIETGGPVRAADLALLERLMDGVSGPGAAFIRDDAVGFGSEVTLEDLDTRARVRHRLMTAETMDLDAGHITTDSPLGLALLGRTPGDVVEFETPLGVRRVRVVEIETLTAFLDRVRPASDGRHERTSRQAPNVAHEPRTGTYG